MTEVKIVMDDYGLLYAILPDGSKRKRSWGRLVRLFMCMRIHMAFLGMIYRASLFRILDVEE